MHTVVARFHHDNRDLSEIEKDLVEQGAEEAVITRYTVAMTIDADSRRKPQPWRSSFSTASAQPASRSPSELKRRKR
jgi:hypothetical protein